MFNQLAAHIYIYNALFSDEIHHVQPVVTLFQQWAIKNSCLQQMRLVSQSSFKYSPIVPQG